MALILCLRRVLQLAYVDVAPLLQRSQRQFRLDMAGVSQFCEETGGDFYDFIPVNGGVLAVVGDVVVTGN